MTMKIREITDCLEQLSPLDHAEDFDNVGLLVGDANAEVTGILVSLDCLESIVDEAIAKSCNLIVCFHPILFKGLKKINGSNYVERTVIKAIKNDIGIYAMAAVVLELLDREKHPDTYNPDWDSVDVVSLPGISALQAGSSAAGAILGHDFCTISLSDLLTPWEVIEQRIHAAGQGDFVIAFYNPVSVRRDWQLDSARDILVEYRPENTPVCLGRNLTRDNQSLEFISLGELDTANVDMFTCVMVGNGESRIIETPGGRKMYTPRGYQRKMN